MVRYSFIKKFRCQSQTLTLQTDQTQTLLAGNLWASAANFLGKTQPVRGKRHRGKSWGSLSPYLSKNRKFYLKQAWSLGAGLWWILKPCHWHLHSDRQWTQRSKVLSKNLHSRLLQAIKHQSVGYTSIRLNHTWATLSCKSKQPSSTNLI